VDNSKLIRHKADRPAAEPSPQAAEAPPPKNVPAVTPPAAESVPAAEEKHGDQPGSKPDASIFDAN
jgi:hypothetical protein